MRIIILTTGILSLAAAAITAEAEYNYPPEYADLFEQFRVITPEEVQIDVALYGDDPWHTYAGGIILEPILLKCINGVPGYYDVERRRRIRPVRIRSKVDGPRGELGRFLYVW